MERDDMRALYELYQPSVFNGSYNRAKQEWLNLFL